MKASTRAAAIFLAVGALLATGSPAQAQTVWTTVPSPNEPGRNLLLGADASDATHVWAVGDLISRDQIHTFARVLRYDGTAWRQAPLSGFPGNDVLTDVDAVSGNEAWAAGSARGGLGRGSTLVARWNGSTWTPEPTPNGNPSGYNSLSGVAAAGGTVWAVGSWIESSTYNHRSLILQRTNGAWRLSTVPRVRANEFVEGVDATGAADAWAVGWSSDGISVGPAVPMALHWNGSGWRSVPVPSSDSTVLNAVDALTANNVWAVGYTLVDGYNKQPYVMHFDGTSWRRIPTPVAETGATLNDVVALSASNVVAVGTAANTGLSLVLHWNGSSWIRESVEPTAKLTGAAAVGPNTFWAVGNTFALNAYEERTFTAVSR